MALKVPSTLKCEYCEFIGTNLKSLAAHQRRCKKNIIIDDNNSVSDIVSEENNTILIKGDDENIVIEENINKNKTKKIKK